MKKKIELLAILILALALGLPRASASPIQTTASQKDNPIVTVKTSPPSQAVAPGDTFELTLELTVAPGFHINSQKPEDELLVPTSVELKKDPALELKEVLFPEARKKKFKFSDKPLSVYEGQVKVKLKIELAEGLCGSNLEIEGKVRYQACDQEACLRPSSVPFKVTIKLAS